jgi:hypothetical protein
MLNILCGSSCVIVSPYAGRGAFEDSRVAV